MKGPLRQLVIIGFKEMSKSVTLKLKLIFPPLVVALAVCIIAMSLAWYTDSSGEWPRSDVSVTTAKNDQQSGTAAIISTIADSYDVVEGNYSVINTGTISGYTGQTGDSKQNAADRAYIIFYKVTLVNDDPKELEAYDYAYISECIITWANSDKTEEYVYGTSNDYALTHFQVIFLKKQELSSGKYTFSSSNSLIIDSSGSDRQVTFFIGLQFYNPNLGQDFIFSDTSYIGSKFALTLQFEQSSNMAFFYTSLRDASKSSSDDLALDGNGYQIKFDSSTGSEDQKYRLIKTPQVDEDTAEDPGSDYGSLVATYQVSEALYLKAQTTLKVYNTLAKFHITDYANNDYKIFKYCYDYANDGAGNFSYYENDDGYPIRTDGYYKIRLRVYENGYKIWIEYPEDITNFYLKGGYNAWGDNEYQKRSQVYYKYDYLYALYNNKLYRVSNIFANTNGAIATEIDFSDINNIDFYMNSDPIYQKVTVPNETDFNNHKYFVIDELGNTSAATGSFDSSTIYFEFVAGGAYFKVTELYNSWGQRITTPLYTRTNIGSDTNPTYTYNNVGKVSLINGFFGGDYYYKIDAYNSDNTPTYHYLNTVLFDDDESSGYYVTTDSTIELSDVTNPLKIYYEKNGQKIQLKSLWFHYEKDGVVMNSNYDDTKDDKYNIFSKVQLTKAGSSFITTLLDGTTEATLIVPKASQIDDGTYEVITNLYYSTDGNHFTEIDATEITLSMMLRASKQIGFNTKGEFLAFNSSEQYYKDYSTVVTGANFMVDPGVYKLTLIFDLTTQEGNLSYEKLYDFNEQTLDLWYIRGSFDTNWGIFDDYKLSVLDINNGLYTITNVYFAKNTQFKISNANWSPAYNKFTLTNTDGIEYIGKSGDGLGDYNLVINVSGLYDFVLNINATTDNITITYRGAYIGDNTRETYWYLYNKTNPTIGDANNFIRENLAISNVCTLSNYFMQKGDTYVLLYNDSSLAEYVSGYFDSPTANENPTKYFEIIRDDNDKPVAKVLVTGFYSFTITGSRLGDQTSYALTYTVTEQLFGPSSLYLRGDMNGWSAESNYQFTSHLGSNYAYCVADVKTGQNFKVADSGWTTEITKFYVIDAIEKLKDTTYTTTDIENLVLSLVENYPDGPGSNNTAINLSFVGVEIVNDQETLTLAETSGNVIVPQDGKVIYVTYLSSNGDKYGYMIYIG